MYISATACVASPPPTPTSTSAPISTATPPAPASSPTRRSSDLAQTPTQTPLSTATPTGTPPCGVFANTAVITIPDSGAAAPYPSTINATGMNGPIRNVTGTLNELSHGFAGDAAVALGGQG